MALKARVPSLDGIPESLHAEYTKVGNEYVLAVDGMVAKDRLDEFRDNNITLKRQLDELNARFDGVDPEVFRELSAKAAKERDKKLIDAGKVDELVGERVGAMKAEHDKVLKSLGDEKSALTKQLEGLVIDGAIRDAAGKAGARPEAIDDFLLRGRQVFRLQDGKAVPMDGDKPIYGKSGDPMPISEWVAGLAERAPHLFAPSIGGGARGVQPGGNAPGTISRDDARSFLANLEKVAKGEVKVA